MQTSAGFTDVRGGPRRRAAALVAAFVVGFVMLGFVGSASAYVSVDNNLSNPQGVALDSTGDVFVGDTSNNRVLEDTPSASGYVQSVPFSSGLNNPRGVAVDAAGDVFIADAYNSRVLEETPNGMGGYTQSTVFSGSSGVYPSGVAVDASGDVFIADGDIYKETPNGSGGYTQTDVISGGFSGFFFQMAVDGPGDLFIADGFNNQVLEETPNGSGGYTQSTVASGLNGPEGVALDGSGNVLVSDTFNNRVLEETPNGSGGYTQSVIAASGLSDPAQIALDGSGDVFIADMSNNRVVELGPATWTGTTATAGNAAATNWSTSTNWASGNPLTGGANGTLTFPALSSCPSGDACYNSHNDLTGAVLSGIQIDDRSGYNVTGNAITLGAGGISASSSVSGSFQSPSWSVPITLGANQTWSIDGGTTSGGPGRLALDSPVTGQADTLGIDLSHSTILNLAGDNEVGAVTVTGDSTGDNLGFASPAGSSLNGTDGNAVSITNASLYTFYPLSLGPLTLNGGTLQLGAGSHTPVATVNGAVSLGSSAPLLSTIAPSASAPAPGTNYSQLSASGSVSLAGTLQLALGTQLGSCSALTLGNVYALVQTTGTGTSLSGTFSNAPDGTVLPVGCNTSPEPTVEIHYTSTSVTATVVTATTTSLQVSPSSPDTNQTVTLTANVAPSSGSSTPSGTVEFDNSGSPIAGCSAQPVDSSGNATCQMSFAAASSPESLSAKYAPGSGALFGGSSSSRQLVFVSPDSTTTEVSASSASPQTGQNVTYTATVTPADAGPAEPSGTVQFLDGGSPISSCSSQALTVGASSSTATCTVSYSSTGPHTIAASYGGDGNFNGSSSSAQTVTVQPPPPSNTAPPTISGAAQVGQRLTESHGSWSNSPTSYSYQWEDCDSSGNNCQAISGATGQSYTLTGSDAGHTVRVVETATNSAGSAQSASAPTRAVVPALPAELSISTSGPVARSGSTVHPGIRLSCQAVAAPCSANETASVLIGSANTPAGSAPHAAHAMTIGSASFTIPAGASVEATFKLNHLGMILLSDHKHLRVQITITGQAHGASPVIATKTIMLRGQFARYKVSAIKVARDGKVSLRVRVSAPGQVNILVSAWKNNLATAARLLNPGPGRFAVARARATARKSGVLTFHLRPNAKDRRLIVQHGSRVPLRLWVSYIPLYAPQTNAGYYGLHPGRSCTSCHQRTRP